LIREIQKRWKELDKKRYKTICDEFKLSLVTVKKYIHMSEEEIQSLDYPKQYKKRKTMTDDYINMIYKMTIDGIAPEAIFSYIIKKGYEGSWEALNSRIRRLLKNNFETILPINWHLLYEYPSGVVSIKRNDIVKEITTKKEKTKRNKELEENIGIITDKYPVIKELEKIYDSFHGLLMGDNPNELDTFIGNYRNSKLNGFIESIEKDIAPIKNAISFPYSSGFVEGNNNKFKLIKRILYGRSKLVNLFRKCYVPFLMNNIDFSLMDLVKENSTISCAA